MFETAAFSAFVIGLISAASLPLGALIAMIWIPRQKIIAVLMAFGGGALLAALTIDLVGGNLEKGNFYPLAAGCILGGLLFDLLNQTVNRKGGFLRKAATTITYLKRKKLMQFRSIFRKMSRVPLFHSLPPEEIQALLPYVSSRLYKQGQVIIRQGDPGDSFFIIETGRVAVIDEKNNSSPIAMLSDNDVMGAIALLTGDPRTATAIAATDTRIWVIFKDDFDRLLAGASHLSATITDLVSRRINDLRDRKTIENEKAEKWVALASQHIDAKHFIPTDLDIREAAEEHNAAPLAIWLGILLDGIPESLVIGASMIHNHISISLIAGLFLSNFPESLSSSIGMQDQAYSRRKIFLMWTSLMIFTGIGAFFGNLFFVEAPPFTFAVANGLAAGAMLTMIAETMLPEAFYKGGAITGFSTLMGFLAAIFFKTLEG